MPRGFREFVVQDDEFLIQRIPHGRKERFRLPSEVPDYIREETIIERGMGTPPPLERGRVKIRVEHGARDRTPRKHWSLERHRDRQRPEHYERLHHNHQQSTEHRHTQDLKPKGCCRLLDCRRHDVVRNHRCAVYDRNRAIHHTDGNVLISPMLARSKTYPPGFRHSKRLVDFMRMHDDDLHDIMKAYDMHPKWHTRRIDWTGRWARRGGRYPLSVDFMKNLELLFCYLGALHIADKLRMVRHDPYAICWWNEDFRIRRI